VGASTIRRVLQRLRIPPAPARATDTTWRQFLRTPVPTMLACDFFRVACVVTLKRIYVISCCKLVAGRCTCWAPHQPRRRWATQQVRNLVMDLCDRLTEFRFLVRDRAGQSPASFDAVLTDVSIRVVRFSSSLYAG
jgi:putative transposase